jgi:hypothetical protein
LVSLITTCWAHDANDNIRAERVVPRSLGHRRTLSATDE